MNEPELIERVSVQLAGSYWNCLSSCAQRGVPCALDVNARSLANDKAPHAGTA